jgi:calcineurin-like phosphoesterase
MNILLLGDIFGKGGRKVVRYVLPRIVDRESVDLTIANVENASRGLGVSRDAARELKKAVPRSCLGCMNTGIFHMPPTAMSGSSDC